MRCQSSSMAGCIDKHLDWQIFVDRNAILLVALSLSIRSMWREEEKKKRRKAKASKSPQILLLTSECFISLWSVLYWRTVGVHSVLRTEYRVRWWTVRPNENVCPFLLLRASKWASKAVLELIKPTHYSIHTATEYVRCTSRTDTEYGSTKHK